MQLFDRVVELTVGGTDITGLDIAFEIEKDETPEPNTCHIEIFNLSLENRSTLSKYRFIPVILKAGYRGQIGILFQGDLMHCSHVKEGNTWKTALAVGDGVVAMQTKRTNKEYAKGTPIRTVVEDLAKQLGLHFSSSLETVKELNTGLSTGFAASGNAMKDLARVFADKKVKLSVQNQSLQVRMHDRSLQKEAISLSPETGLIASPEINSRNELVVKCLVMAELAPGRQVFIDSATWNGFATIETARFVGSNFDHAWNAELMVKASI